MDCWCRESLEDVEGDGGWVDGGGTGDGIWKKMYGVQYSTAIECLHVTLTSSQIVCHEGRIPMRWNLSLATKSAHRRSVSPNT